MDPFPGSQSLKDFRGNCQTQVRISAVVFVEKDTPLDIESCNQPTIFLRLSNVTKSFWFFFSSNSFSSSLQTYWIASASQDIVLQFLHLLRRMHKLNPHRNFLSALVKSVIDWTKFALVLKKPSLSESRSMSCHCRLLSVVWFCECTLTT